MSVTINLQIGLEWQSARKFRKKRFEPLLSSDANERQVEEKQMKAEYVKPDVTSLGDASDITKSQNLTNADDTNQPNSANPFNPGTS